jgi:hypothetical protein
VEAVRRAATGPQSGRGVSESVSNQPRRGREETRREAFLGVVEAIRAGESALLSSYKEDVGSDLELVDAATGVVRAVLVRVAKRAGQIAIDAEAV